MPTAPTGKGSAEMLWGGCSDRAGWLWPLSDLQEGQSDRERFKPPRVAPHICLSLRRTRAVSQFPAQTQMVAVPQALGSLNRYTASGQADGVMVTSLNSLMVDLGLSLRLCLKFTLGACVHAQNPEKRIEKGLRHADVTWGVISRFLSAW